MPKTARNAAALYRTFGPLIYSRCRRALHDEALAVTATQEVFVRVLAALARSGPGSRAAVEVLAEACDAICADHPAFRAS